MNLVYIYGPGHRREMGKIATVELLRENVATRDFFTPIPYRYSLRIDNTDLTAPTVARRIIDHFGLPTVTVPG